MEQEFQKEIIDVLCRCLHNLDLAGQLGRWKGRRLEDNNTALALFLKQFDFSVDPSRVRSRHEDQQNLRLANSSFDIVLPGITRSERFADADDQAFGSRLEQLFYPRRGRMVSGGVVADEN